MQLTINTEGNRPSDGFAQMASYLITARCDHCREGVGVSEQRYWRMCFCSPTCMTAYQKRLTRETKEKISLLEMVIHSRFAKDEIAI